MPADKGEVEVPTTPWARRLVGRYWLPGVTTRLKQGQDRHRQHRRRRSRMQHWQICSADSFQYTLHTLHCKEQ
jgi:hypothetical protein